MASKTAILAVRIVTESKDGVKGLQEYSSGVDKLGGALDKATIPAAAALTALAAVGSAAVSAASDLQQATGAVEAIFGAYADQVEGFAQDAADNVGLAESQYSQLASVLGAQLKNMGIPMEAVAGQTNDLITLGADLAAQFGGSTADAVAALSSLLRGERDPIERYGVSIKQADIDAQKLAMGLDGATGAAAKQADTQATLALLYQQTSAAAGTFADETDTLAGSQQIAAAKFEDAKAALGEGLLPAMTLAAQIGAELGQVVADNSTLFSALALILGTVAAAVLVVNGALKAWQAATVLVTAAQWLLNVALNANPIGLVVIAIGLLIAIIVVLVMHWDELSAVVADVWQNIIGWIQDGIGWIQDAIGWFGKLLGIQGEAQSGQQATRATQGLLKPPDSLARGLEYSPGALVASPVAPSTGRVATQAATQVVNITVNGALDPDRVARQIDALLKNRAARTGASAAAGGGLR